MTEQPQIYLISPPDFDIHTFPEELAKVLDAHDIACVRLALATQDEDHLARAADACRDVAIERDVAIVIDDHTMLAQRLGLDGVHLSDAGKSVRDARTALGVEAIVGSFCGTSRHDGMSAGEAGADYISFGPAGVSNLGTGAQVDFDLFKWWSEVIEVPVVAEGALTADVIADLSQFTDFFGIREIWDADVPSKMLGDWIARMS
ncbi:MAG: thiamine phosphate synthase [Paracoccaceae bacterium]